MGTRRGARTSLVPPPTSQTLSVRPRPTCTSSNQLAAACLPAARSVGLTTTSLVDRREVSALKIAGASHREEQLRTLIQQHVTGEIYFMRIRRNRAGRRQPAFIHSSSHPLLAKLSDRRSRCRSRACIGALGVSTSRDSGARFKSCCSIQQTFLAQYTESLFATLLDNSPNSSITISTSSDDATCTSIFICIDDAEYRASGGVARRVQYAMSVWERAHQPAKRMRAELFPCTPEIASGVQKSSGSVITEVMAAAITFIVIMIISGLNPNAHASRRPWVYVSFDGMSERR